MDERREGIFKRSFEIAMDVLSGFPGASNLANISPLRTFSTRLLRRKQWVLSKGRNWGIGCFAWSGLLNWFDQFFPGFASLVPAFPVARFTFPFVLQLFLKLLSGVDLR
jgi:hypothetical protein